MSDEINFDPSDESVSAPDGYRRSTGLLLTAPSMNEFNRFGMSPIAGPVVYKVLPGSAGEIAGFVRGDMILQVDGMAVNSLPGSSKDLVGSVAVYLSLHAQTESAIVLLVQRNSDELTLKLVF